MMGMGGHFIFDCLVGFVHPVMMHMEYGDSLAAIVKDANKKGI